MARCLQRADDPGSARAATGRAACNHDGPPPFAAAHGQATLMSSPESPISSPFATQSDGAILSCMRCVLHWITHAAARGSIDPDDKGRASRPVGEAGSCFAIRMVIARGEQRPRLAERRLHCADLPTGEKSAGTRLCGDGTETTGDGTRATGGAARVGVRGASSAVFVLFRGAGGCDFGNFAGAVERDRDLVTFLQIGQLS